MLALIFILPPVTALLCLALSRRALTRWLGVGSAAALLACAVALVIARLQGQLPFVLIDRTWMALGEHAVPLVLAFDAANWLFALLALGGGGLSVLMLALAVPPNVRGFGGLFAAALLVPAVVAFGLANQGAMLLPFIWALVALLVFLALRVSGALAGSDAPLIVLLAGLAGTLIVLGAVLLMTVALPGGVALEPILICWVLVGLLALGGPPFHTPVQALAEAPAALAGVLLATGLPLLGGYTLIRLVVAQGAALPQGWSLVFTLLALLTLLACAAGALRTTRLRKLVGWQFSAQMGLLLLALGQGGSALMAAAPALLVNGTLATLTCYLAIGQLERRAGTDDMTEIDLRQGFRLPGLVFLAGAASAAGLPGTWGWWARWWLFAELLRTTPWAVPVLLAASALLAFTFIAPLALFWRRTAQPQDGQLPAPGRTTAALVGAAAAAPLLILGAAPGLAWSGWLADLPTGLRPGAPGVAVWLPDTPALIASGLATLLLIMLPFVARGSRRAPLPETQPHQPGVAVPRALGESLRALAWAAAPEEAFNVVWQALLRISGGLRRGLALLEQRYYLAGLLIAVILVIMLFIQ